MRLVCWDLDGTLTDSVRLVVETFDHVVTRNGGVRFTAEDILERIGLSLESTFRLAFADVAEPELHRYVDEYRAHYEAVMIPRTALYEGASETLRAFHEAGVVQATVTGKRAGDCERILRGLGVGDCFDLFLGGDSVAASKPAPDLVLEAMRRAEARADETLVVGDARVDIEMGRAAGARTCLVLWGASSTPLGREDHVARSFADIGRIVASPYTAA